MIKTETIGNSKEKFLILECRCRHKLVLPEKTTKDTIESKGWYIEKKKNLALCPGCIEEDKEKREQGKQQHSD
jgi:hypothetical protein